MNAISELLEQRNQVAAQIDDLLANVETEGRALTVDERATYDRLVEAYELRSEAVARAEEQARSERALAELGDPAPTADDGGDRSEAARFAEFVAGETRSFVSMPERRDLLAGTATGAAELVPTTLYDSVVTAMLDQSPIVDLAQRLDTATGEKIQVPTATAFGAQVTAEADAIGENDPTSALVDLDVSKYTNLVQVSSELLSDSVVDLAPWIGENVAAALSNSFGTAVSAAVAAGATAGATPGAVSRDLLIDLQYSGQGVHRRRGAFVANSATVASIRKLASADGVSGVWAPALAAGQPESLLGAPLYVDDTLADDGTVLFGDFRRAVMVRFAGGLRLERSTDFAFANDLVTWRAVMRAGSAVVDSGAVKVLTAS